MVKNLLLFRTCAQLVVPCSRSYSCLAHVHLPQTGRALLQVLLQFSACALASGWWCLAQGPAPV